MANRGSESSLAGALAGMKAYRNQLRARRSEIDDRIEEIDFALAAMDSDASELMTARDRPGMEPRLRSLKDYIARALHGHAKGKSVASIAVAVKKAGYKSKNKRINHGIGAALADMEDVVRVARGVYRLK